MNEDLPNVIPLDSPTATRLSTADAWRMIQGLQPGRYITADLYPRYVAWATREGVPVGGRKILGEALRRLIGRDAGKAHGNVSVFELTREVLDGTAFPPSRIAPYLPKVGQD